jgi:hypothetical protein
MTIGQQASRSLIVIVVTVFDQVSIRKHLFFLHQVVMRLVLASEAGGNVGATGALVS